MKNVEEKTKTFVINILNESDNAFCKGCEFIIDKDTDEILDKDSVNYCS